MVTVISSTDKENYEDEGLSQLSALSFSALWAPASCKEQQDKQVQAGTLAMLAACGGAEGGANLRCREATGSFGPALAAINSHVLWQQTPGTKPCTDQAQPQHPC